MARRIITDNLDKINLLANALIEYETLDVEDVNLLLDKGMEALRLEFLRRETAPKPRVAKVAFTSKLSDLLATDNSQENDADKQDKQVVFLIDANPKAEKKTENKGEYDTDYKADQDKTSNADDKPKKKDDDEPPIELV